MKIFSADKQTKRVIFNLDAELAARLELAKQNAKSLGKKLDIDSAVDKAIEKFLKKSEKKLAEMIAEAQQPKLTIGAEPARFPEGQELTPEAASEPEAETSESPTD